MKQCFCGEVEQFTVKQWKHPGGNAGKDWWIACCQKCMDKLRQLKYEDVADRDGDFIKREYL